MFALTAAALVALASPDAQSAEIAQLEKKWGEASVARDFDFIESGAEAGAPKYMEWYGAFGLVVTLVWLYLEILRLLAKLQSRE